MIDIIRTWPASMAPRDVREVFSGDHGTFYFTLGRGMPQQQLRNLYWTHRGRIVGHFRIRDIVQNIGQFPTLHAISDWSKEWRVKPDTWVTLCEPPFYPLRERLFFPGFRGWRYFDLEKHRGTLDAKVWI
jgi:hypothetical protein